MPNYLCSDINYYISSPTTFGGTINYETIQYWNCAKSFGNSAFVSLVNYPIVDLGASLVSTTSDSIGCGLHCVYLNNNGNTYLNVDGIYSKSVFIPFIGFNPNPVAFLGQPPVNGWVLCNNPFTMRDTSIENIIFATIGNNLTEQNRPVTYSRIYPFPQGISSFTDHSPRFNSEAVIFCKAGDTVLYQPGIYDMDGDSFSVQWAPIISGRPAPGLGGSTSFWPIGSLPPAFTTTTPPIKTYKIDTVNYAPGYSYTSPLPDTAFNPNNIPASLDAATGDISFLCHNPGNYAAAVNVFSYRNGQVISEVHRELFITVFPPDSNHNPIINIGPYNDTIFAGDSLMIPFSITDADTADWVYFSAYGYTLDSNLTGGGGCGLPPCAFFPLLTDTFQSFSFGFLKWKTDCNHCSAVNNAVTYSFSLKAKDDYCPVHGSDQNTIRITILKPPPLPAPRLHCASVDSAGNVLLSWEPVVDSSGVSFRQYRILAANSPSGPFSPVDSLSNINAASFWHLGAGANVDTMFYVVQTFSSCKPVSIISSDTISTIFLQLGNSGTGIASLSWNDIRDSATASAFYHIFRSINHAPFVLVDSTLALNWVDTLSVCSLRVDYYIALPGAFCSSRSNIRHSVFSDLIPPDMPRVDTVSVLPSAMLSIAWKPPRQKDVVAYIVQKASGVTDTVWGDSSYTSTPGAGTAGDCFAVAAMDSCGNTSAFTPPRCPVGIEVKADICAGSIRIVWKHNQDSLRLAYRLFVATNGANPVLLASLTAADTSFVWSPSAASGNYCFFVRAMLSAGRSTTSNRFCLKADFSIPHNYTYCGWYRW